MQDTQLRAASIIQMSLESVPKLNGFNTSSVSGYEESESGSKPSDEANDDSKVNKGATEELQQPILTLESTESTS